MHITCFICVGFFFIQTIRHLVFEYYIEMVCINGLDLLWLSFRYGK